MRCLQDMWYILNSVSQNNVYKSYSCVKLNLLFCSSDLFAQLKPSAPHSSLSLHCSSWTDGCCKQTVSKGKAQEHRISKIRPKDKFTVRKNTHTHTLWESILNLGVNLTYFRVKKLLSQLSILQTAVSWEVGRNSLKKRNAKIKWAMLCLIGVRVTSHLQSPLEDASSETQGWTQPVLANVFF